MPGPVRRSGLFSRAKEGRPAPALAATESGYHLRAVCGIIRKIHDTKLPLGGGGKGGAPGFGAPQAEDAGFHQQETGKGQGGMDVRVGDILTMKKNHPCGGREFLVLRSGMDFRIRCTTCGREMMLPRLRVEKNIKKITRPSPGEEG